MGPAREGSTLSETGVDIFFVSHGHAIMNGGKEEDSAAYQVAEPYAQY